MEPRDPRPLTPPDDGPTAVEVAIEHLYALEPCCAHFVLHAEVEPWADLDAAREAVAADLPEWCNRCAVELVADEFADTESFLAALRRPTAADMAAVLDRFGVAVDGLAEALADVPMDDRERQIRAAIAADLRRFAGEVEARPRDSNTQKAIGNARVRLILSLAQRIENGEEVSDG